MAQRLFFFLFTGFGLGIWGCSSNLDPDFEHGLDLRGACADTLFFAHDRDDSTLLVVRAQGLLEDVGSGETSFEFELPDAAVDVHVDVGSNISDAVCDDVIENGGPDVTRTYVSVSGNVVIVVRPGSGEFDLPRADLTLSDVVLEAKPGGETVTLESFEILDVTVGWFPG